MNKPAIKKRLKRFLTCTNLAFLIGIIMACCGYKIMRTVTFDAHVIGDSMASTLFNDEHTIGIRFGWLQPELERGDIISFLPPIKDGDDLYVKRVIGLPGETVAIKNGRIYINGSEEALEEPYLTENWTVDAGPYYFEVPKGHYLVLGDNRNDSYDSRHWDEPYVSYESILSKTCFVYWPFLHFRYLY